MRRKRASTGSFSITRSGVTDRPRHKKRNAQSPVLRISVSAGLAPSVLANTPYTKCMKGNKASSTKTSLAARWLSQRVR